MNRKSIIWLAHNHDEYGDSMKGMLFSTCICYQCTLAFRGLMLSTFVLMQLEANIVQIFSMH